MVTTAGLSGAASRGAITAVVGQWAKFCVQLMSLALLARILAPGDFGLYAMVAAIAGLATLLSDFGLSLAAMRSTELSRQQRSNLFWANLALGSAASLLVFFAAYPVGLFYGNSELVAICQALAVTFLAQAASAQLRAELARNLRVFQLTICDVSAAITALTAALLVAMNGGGVWALVIQQITLTVSQLVYLSFCARWIPSFPRRAPGMGALFQFGANTGGVQLVNYVTANADTVLLGKVWGPDVVGVYNQAYQLFRVPLQQLAAPMTQVAVPVLSRLTDHATFEAYVKRAHLVLSYVLGGAFFIAAALAIPGLDLLLGPGWDLAPFLFAILAIGGVFQALGYVYYWVFITKNLTGLQLKYALISRGLMVALIIAGLPFGSFGVATAASVGLALNWLILSVFALPHANLRWQELALISTRPLTIFTVMFVVAFPIGVATRFMMPSALQLGLLISVCLLTLGGSYAISRNVRSDFRMILKTARAAGNRREVN
jgi:O-antigen/teichoic acid export membrane protein